MAIDKKPAPGRIYLGVAQSTSFFPWYLKGGVIQDVKGDRIYYTDPETGKRKYTHTFSVVCDTQEEETQLLAFTEREKAALALYRNGISARAQELERGSVTMKSISRVRRK